MTPDGIGDYRQLTAATAVLTELAAGPDGDHLAAVLAGDALVLARMRAARSVVAAAGLSIEPIPAGSGLLSEATRWQHYALGPVSPLHRDCATDIARGLLRLWARERSVAHGAPVSGRLALRQARVDLSGRVRTSCVALRAELREACAAATGREEPFRAEVMRRAAQLCQDIGESVEWTLGDPAGAHEAPVPAVEPPPPSRPGGPEHRLTLLLAAGFGTGAALAAARLLGEVLPSLATALGSVTLGLLLGGWVARTRRAISRRATLERWIGELTAALRAALDEHVAARILAAEVTLERRR